MESASRLHWAPVSVGSKVNEEMKLEDAKVEQFAKSEMKDSYDMVLSSQDFLDLTLDETMRSQCAETIHRYGLGSCSPRGFYGTFRPHMDLEAKIAKFLGVGEAVLYSFGVCTASSVIQALASKSDVAVVDRGVGPSIIAGLRLAKLEIRWYNHADPADAARVFAQIETEDGSTSARLTRPVRRRWLITEACFGSTGRCAPLRELVALKDHHHARMILDESFSFGAMGESGRGLIEHVGLPSSSVDVICASLENACASVGGFVAGDTGVVAYQRLMGSGYVFSASLPPYLATASLHAISRIEAEPAMVEKLHDAARRTRFLLSLCSRFSSSSMEPGKNRFAGYFLNLRQSSSAMSEITCNAFSRSALLCAAEMQKRTRGSVIGVAGEPTTTTAKPRLKARREKSPILYG